MQLLLTETVNTFKTKEWFRDVSIYNAHPSNGEPTIEFKVNYIPIFEKKDVATYALGKNIGHMFTIVDKDGNKTA